MANFQTHITAGVITGGLLSTVAMAAAIVTPGEAVFLTIAGTVGSILPDMDLEGSKQSRAIFGGFGILFAFIFLFRYSQFLSIAELGMLWISIYVLVRYLLWKSFHEFTVHRGLFHSILANAFFAIVGTVVFYYLLHKSDVVSWLGGAILFLGALSHLLLDELYSIDFAGNRVKRSFGTALKLYDYKKPATAILLSMVLAGFVYVAPPVGNFYALIKSPDNWAYVHNRLLPQGKWFDVKVLKEHLARADDNPPTSTASVN